MTGRIEFSVFFGFAASDSAIYKMLTWKWLMHLFARTKHNFVGGWTSFESA
jgi:hypothetical protein